MLSPTSFYAGGFSYGLGGVAARGTGPAPVPPVPNTSPGTPVRCHRLIPTSIPVTAGAENALVFQTFTLDDQDILLSIGAGLACPASITFPDSVINPTLDFIANRDSNVAVQVNNLGRAAAAMTGLAGFRASVNNPNVNLGVEGSTLEGVQDTGTGRLLALGSVAAGGAPDNVYSGTPLSARDLALFHLCVSSEQPDLQILTVQLDDYDFLTGGTIPHTFCSHDNPAFSFRGAVATKSTTITVTTGGAATVPPVGVGTQAAGITARVV